MFNLFSGKPFGLSITDEAVRVVGLKGKGNQLILTAIGQKELPKGVVEQGVIADEKTLTACIKVLLKETGIKQKKCIVALPESQSYEHVFYFQKELKDQPLKEAIDKKVEEVIPIPFEEIKYDYVVHSTQK
ncbi:MAG: pilus assembly protein PilM, partial [Candidatus Peregrinibacteria bacterium]